MCTQPHLLCGSYETRIGIAYFRDGFSRSLDTGGSAAAMPSPHHWLQQAPLHQSSGSEDVGANFRNNLNKHNPRPVSRRRLASNLQLWSNAPQTDKRTAVVVVRVKVIGTFDAPCRAWCWGHWQCIIRGKSGVVAKGGHDRRGGGRLCASPGWRARRNSGLPLREG